MKNSKKMFILAEVILGVMVIALAVAMIWEKTGKDKDKISVIVQNSDDDQWAAFKYGLKMAAEDQQVEMSVVGTSGTMTVEEQKRIIEEELEHGAGAVIVQPIPGVDGEEMLKRMESKLLIMLVEHKASEEKEASAFPVTKPDHYGMGMALAEELKKDCNERIAGKTVGILSETSVAASATDRRQGFLDGLKDSDVNILWFASSADLEIQPKVDFVIALDDESLTTAGQYAAVRNLHGALVYGIGNSTEAAYYLDVGSVECLIVPDEFSVGYWSLTEVSERLSRYWGNMQEKVVSYTVIRRDTLFTKENQKILFTMSQ